MDKEKRHINPKGFEDLMLESMLSDYDSNSEIQKTMDMTADYIFSQPVDVNIATKINQKIKALFPINVYNIIFKAITLILLLAGIWFLTDKYTSNNIKPEIPQKNAAFIAPADSITKIESKKADEVESKINIDNVIEFEKRPDTLDQAKEPEQKGGFARTNPPQKSGYLREAPFKFDYDYAIDITDFEGIDKKIQAGELNLKAYGTQLQNFAIQINKHNYIQYKAEILKSDSATTDKAGQNKERVKATLRKSTLIPIYQGTPFKKGFDHLQYIRPERGDLFKNISYMKSDIVQIRLPEALQYYFNFNEISPIKVMSQKNNYKYIQPFYISKTEVSNIDYQEFLRWVIKYNDFESEIKETQSQITTYEKNPKYFEYHFHNPNKEIIKRFGKNTVNVFPDINCWSKDGNGFMDNMDSSYAYHPAYAHYPVVGISYWQALAYTDWLTFMWQEQINRLGIPYDIKVDLPHDREWEMAVDKISHEEALYFNSSSILCNLNITSKNKLLNQAIGITPGLRNNNSKNFMTSLVNEYNESFNKNELGIYNMDANVSEWLKTDYSTYRNYQNMINAALKENDTPENRMVLQLEQYFDECNNDKNGKLVRGANWMDDRSSGDSYNKLDAYTAKAFINPDKQHSTLGFRYVMRVKLKNEEEIVHKIKVLGAYLPKIDYSSLKPEEEKAIIKNAPGFAFCPMGSFKYKGETVSTNAFWAKHTEVTNLTWMLFLNYLLDNNRDEDIKKCMPADKHWALKMNYETRLDLQKLNIKQGDLTGFLPFPNKFIKETKIDKLPVSLFAYEPVTGISHEAALLFAKWLTEIYGNTFEFRLPTEQEWYYMANAGYKGETGNKSEKTLEKEPVLYPIPQKEYNAYQLFNLQDNACEMLSTPEKIMGGNLSDNQNAKTIEHTEKWNGKAHELIGFRIVASYIGGKE